MRLIDADRLQKQFNEKSTNPNYRVNMHNIKSIITNVPTVEAIPIPKSATNGDMIKAIFPNFQCEDETEYFHRLMNPNNTEFLKTSKNWWNAPYKENEDATN